jgi:dTDP-4-dehydrorhamnose reductase
VPGAVLVTGATGRLASFIIEAFADRPVVAATRAQCDILDPASVRQLVSQTKPAVIINCAAYNNVDGAEDSPGEALQINASGVRTLARAAEECGATLVHYSTDFVFDGEGVSEPYSEEHPPSPRSAYAVSKLLGEWFALDAPRAFVLRVESLFGCPPGWAGPRGTLDKLIDSLRSAQEVTVFTDRIVSPSYLTDVAQATRYLVDGTAWPGLYHCVNAGHASWKEVAEEAARVLGVVPRLRPVRVADVSMRAARPRYCALSNQKLSAAGFVMPTWQDAIRRCVHAAPAAHT